jgi:hypothetical protein
MSEKSADTFVAPPPSPELERLEPLVGRWRTRAHSDQSILGPGVQVTSVEEFYRLDGHHLFRPFKESRSRSG